MKSENVTTTTVPAGQTWPAHPKASLNIGANLGQEQALQAKLNKLRATTPKQAAVFAAVLENTTKTPQQTCPLRLTGHEMSEADKIRLREERIAARIRAAHMPTRHQQTQLEAHAKQEAILSQTCDLMGSKGAIIVLSGTRGTGKTQIACELIKGVCENHPVIPQGGTIAEYIKAMDLFSSIRATYETKGVSEESAINRYILPILLVIDEFQERAASQFEDRVMTHIIDRRYDLMRDTVIITNLEPKMFAVQAGASIMDRIRETGSIIECKWPSLRR